MSVEIEGKEYSYFDNAATTYPKPESVYEALDYCNRNLAFNAGRGQYVPSSKANKIIEDTRKAMCELFHCNGSQTCIFTDSATTALNTIIMGSVIEEGSYVYITPFEHNSVIRTLYVLQNVQDFTIVPLPFDFDKCEYDIERINKTFNDMPPSLLIMTHASNTFGFITPIEEIAKLAKKANKKCEITVDGAQTSGLIDTDLSSGLFDYFVFAGHKTLYGPFGVAGFFCNKNTELGTFIYGGTGTDSGNLNMPTELPSHFEAGSHNINAIYGLKAAIDEIKKEGIENLWCKEMESRVKLIDTLKRFDNIEILGEASKNSVGIVSCTFKDYSPDEIGSVLDKLNICVRTGLHCAPMGHKYMDTFPSGTVRFSVGRYTTDEDFKSLENALNYIKENS